MHPSTLIVVLSVCLALAFSASNSTEGTSLCEPERTLPTSDEIRAYYKRYEDHEALTHAYLIGLAHGFELGVHGQAAHLRSVLDSMTIEGARVNGFRLGYRHGLGIHCRMMGGETRYRNID